MSASLPLEDAPVRDRIKNSLDETLFVEAGAGTGKTTCLVERVMTLALSGRTTLDRVAVITFTEAAAAELRDRIRERLEVASSDESLLDEERSRAFLALQDLDRSYIQTLHSLGGSILRERPLEAGLPPAFETMDAISSELAFEETWKEWVDWALDDPELAAPLSLALSLGLSLGQLRDVASEFHNNYDLLADASFPEVSMPEPAAVPLLVEKAPELQRQCGYSKLQDSDVLFAHVQKLLRSVNRLAEMDAGSSNAYRLLLRTMPIRQSRGRQQDWEVAHDTSENACKYLKDLLAGIEDSAAEELAQVRQAVLMPLLRALQRFALEGSRQRKAAGKAGFHDLLVWCRDLLRDNIEVRDHFRRHFSHVLVDEAQDTDPIQAEIAMFIAEDAHASRIGTERPASWKDTTPEPGKLFVVGDPKQSIYRFRRADTRQMALLQQFMGDNTVHLVQNFRSRGPVLDWVNHVFENWMQEGAEQANYVPLLPSGAPAGEKAGEQNGPPNVHWLGGAMEGNAAVVRREEAQAIANLLRNIGSGGWQVRQAAPGGEQGNRPATYSDVCILVPVRTGLSFLEQALDDVSIPYRLEGASLIFATQEVRDLQNCLRAIDDPADLVAVAAALRSPAFACTDVDLLQFVESGGSFDYLSPVVSQSGPVAQALEVLRKFHGERHWTSSPALIDRFIRERMLMESAVNHPRTREQWRRYRFMVEQARAFSEAGGGSLRHLLDWMERQAAEGARITETPVPEEDEEAVRIMTVHAAKGLEFPIVLLSGLNSQRSFRSPLALFDRQTGAVEVRAGSGASVFATPGYELLAEHEKNLDADEYVRLLYVATTRARDHLVLSLYRTNRNSVTGASSIARLMEDAGSLWEQPLVATVQQTNLGQGPADSLLQEDHSLEAREEWLAHREEVLQSRARPLSVAATKLAQVFKDEPDNEQPWKRGRAGTNFGRAVHSVLQTIDLATGDGIDETSSAQAAAEGIPHRREEVARLARVAVESNIVRRAVSASRYWREVPVAAPMAEGVLEGFIDLLFEEDGGLVLVDYKTDSVDSGQTADAAGRYRLQAGAYALSVQKATGKTVKEVVFLFLHSGNEETLLNVAELAGEAEAAAQSFFTGIGGSRS